MLPILPNLHSSLILYRILQIKWLPSLLTLLLMFWAPKHLYSSIHVIYAISLSHVIFLILPHFYSFDIYIHLSY